MIIPEDHGLYSSGSIDMTVQYWAGRLNVCVFGGRICRVHITNKSLLGVATESKPERQPESTSPLCGPS